MLILDAIEQKRSKGGAAYAAGKTLVVFLEAGAGSLVSEQGCPATADTLHFATVWVVGLQQLEDGEYVYAATNLDVSHGDAPAFHVRVGRTWWLA